jgi:uncharacterized membrane protein YhaH (DUF805 family)
MKTWYRKFIDFVGKIPQDKLLHFIVGIIIFFLVYSGVKPFFPENLCIARGIAFFFVLLAALVKEYLIDRRCMDSEPDLIDAYATDLGGIFALIVSLVI